MGRWVGCWWSVGRWSICRWFGDRFSVVGGSVEGLSVGRWLVVGGRWPVGGWWFCNTPMFVMVLNTALFTPELSRCVISLFIPSFTVVNINKVSDGN